MAKPLERTPLPLAQLERTVIQKLVRATHVIGHHLRCGQGDRLVIRRLLRNSQRKLLIAHRLLVFREGLVRLALLQRDLDVLDAERNHKRDDRQSTRRAASTAADFRRLAHLTIRSRVPTRRARIGSPASQRSRSSARASAEP